MQCYYRLPIDISKAIQSDWVQLKNDNWISIMYDPKEIFTITWLDIMSNLGFPADRCYVFYTPPGIGAASFSHTDTHPLNNTGCIAAFNFVIGPDPSDMVWFNQQSLQAYRRILYTDSGDPYETFPVDFNHEIDRCRIGKKLTLVRTDIPHWISTNNISPIGRLCISYRTSRTWSSWKECVNHCLSQNLLSMAEVVGFEPTDHF